MIMIRNFSSSSSLPLSFSASLGLLRRRWLNDSRRDLSQFRKYSSSSPSSSKAEDDSKRTFKSFQILSVMGSEENDEESPKSRPSESDPPSSSSSSSGRSRKLGISDLVRLVETAEASDSSSSSSSTRENDDPTLIVRILERVQKINNDSVMGTRALLDGLESLGKLNRLFPKIDSNLSRSAAENVINVLTWRARYMSIKDLLATLTFLRSNSSSLDGLGVGGGEFESKLAKVLRQEVVKALERRWVEIEGPDSLISIIYFHESFSQHMMERIEDRLMEISESLSEIEIVKVMVALAATKRRQIPLLKALIYHLKKECKNLDLQRICDALYALTALTYSDTELIKKLCEDIHDKILECESKDIIVSLLTSFSRLRFKDENILNEITNWFSKHLDRMGDREMTAYLMTFAYLDNKGSEQTPGGKAVFEHIKSKLSQRQDGKKFFWLDIVWSLALLGQADPSLLESVLSESFYSNVLHSSKSRTVGDILKLMNINAIATYLTPGYSGPRIRSEDLPPLAELKGNKPSQSSLKKDCISIFSNFACPPAHLVTRLSTDMGFEVDAECVMSLENMKPFDISKYAIFDPNSANETLPPNSRRVAVMVASYFDTLLDTRPGGIFSLYVRLLEARSFKVLVMNYSDYASNKQLTEKVKFTEKRLKTLLQIS